MMDGNGWSNGGWGWGAWIFMAIMMLIFFALAAAAVVALIRASDRRRPQMAPPPATGSDDALRLLDERFARGDIDTDDYTKRRELLRSR